MWAVVASEEALKAFASTREQRQIDRFWLVTLFGIWELILDKSVLGLILGHEVATWTGLQIAGLLYATALPALMHTVTAAIYAFTSKTRIWAAFLAGWTVHFAFNESVGWFGISFATAFVETTILVTLLIAIFQHARAQRAAQEAIRT
jgi:hypothetical protein